MKSTYSLILLVSALSGLGLTSCLLCTQVCAKPAWKAGRLTLISKQVLDAPSPLHGASFQSANAFYVTGKGVEMVGPKGRSMDNGRTWTPFTPTPDPMQSLQPANHRRDMLNAHWVDPINGLLLHLLPSFDAENNPNELEPLIASYCYYVRYRVSADKGATYLFDEPMVQNGYSAEHPFPGVWAKKNGYYLGDIGSVPIRTRKGNILIPTQVSPLGSDGRLANPGGGDSTYTDVMIIIGKWKKDKHIDWYATSLISGDPAKSTRGMIEPTLTELPDGRILCVMRGSNGGSKDRDYQIPTYRWYSVSADGGFHWSKPNSMKYDTGEAFYSPSSMSQLLRHSNGRIYWIGNISSKICQGNNPRHPLYIGEVNPSSLALVKSTLTMIDGLQPDDTKGVCLSHFLAYEDRETHEIVLPMYRYNLAYTKSKPVLYRIGVR